MAAIPKLSPDQWAAVRVKWEGDTRKGFPWLVEELSLPVSAEAVRLRSKSESWVKASYSSIAKVVETKAAKQKAKLVDKTKLVKSDKTKLVKHEKPKLAESEKLDDEPLRGRPTLYREEYAEQARELCLMGATNEMLAEAFEVTTSTIILWISTHREFSVSIKQARMIADGNVAGALYKSAMGLHVSTEDKLVSDGEGGQEVITLTKQVDPAVSAQIFWLKNRQPKLWKDRVEVKEDINLNVFPPREALDAIYAKALSEAAARDALLTNRRERMGITIENGEDD